MSADCTVTYICKHCTDSGVRVRFVFDISSSNRSSRAFKLAIGRSDKHIIEDETFWPEGVVLRSWRPLNRRMDEESDGGVFSNYHQSGYYHSDHAEISSLHSTETLIPANRTTSTTASTIVAPVLGGNDAMEESIILPGGVGGESDRGAMELQREAEVGNDGVYQDPEIVQTSKSSTQVV